MAPLKTGPLLLEPAGHGGIYIVSAGDNLTTILHRHSQSTLANPQAAIDELLEDNPHIKNPNQIFPGQPIFLRHKGATGRPLPPATRSDVHSALRTLNSNKSPQLSSLARNSDAVGLLIGGADNVSGQFNSLVKSNQLALNALISKHQAYRTAGVTQQGYREFSRARTDVLQQMQRSFGPAAKPLLGGTPKQSTALKPGRSANPTARLSTSANRLGKASTALRAGGVILKAADVVVTAEVTRQKVCAADTRLEKNQEFMGGFGSIGGGVGGGALGTAAGGIIVAVALGSNPAGWAVLLIVGAAGVGGGFLGSKAGESGAKRLYTEYGQGYDVVEATRVERLCN